MKNVFKLEDVDYVVECAECPLGRGGDMSVRIIIDEEPMDLWFRGGWCSSGGTDCGSDICITSFSSATDHIYQAVKQDKCSSITEVGGGQDSACAGQENYDHTETVMQSCFGGGYEIVEGQKKTFGIKQISNRCNSKVDFVQVPCFDNRQKLKQ